MATSSNREWAFREATRRAAALDGPYAIYRHRTNVDDYIIKTIEAAPPHVARWRHVATIQPDGSKSFDNE